MTPMHTGLVAFPSLLMDVYSTNISYEGPESCPRYNDSSGVEFPSDCPVIILMSVWPKWNFKSKAYLGGCVLQSPFDPCASITVEKQVCCANLLLFSCCQESFVFGAVLSSLQGPAGISWGEVEIFWALLQPSSPGQCYCHLVPTAEGTMSFFENRCCVGWPCLMGRI